VTVKPPESGGFRVFAVNDLAAIVRLDRHATVIIPSRKINRLAIPGAIWRVCVSTGLFEIADVFGP
jgi:hypothetical protein